MKETAIQKYLRSGKTLTDLKQEYHIECITNEELGVVVFNYTHLTPMNTEIGLEARALFLELDSWNVVGKSFGGFKNIDDAQAKDVLDFFDWDSAKAYQKYDGCLVVLYFYKNEWRLGTRFSTDGKCNVYSPNSGEGNIHWIDVFKNTLVEYGLNWNEFTAKLNISKYYTFELCTPWNRNTVIYEKSLIKLIAIVNSNTLLEELPKSSNLEVFEAEFNTVENLEEVKKLNEINNNPLENEGYVIVDKNFRRLKVRNPKYDQLSFVSYSEDDFNNLKNYSVSIMVGSSLIEYWCVQCTGSESNPGTPYNACLTGSSPGNPPIMTGYIGCSITGPFVDAVDCSNNCVGSTGGGGGGLSIQSTKTCSTAWNPKPQSITKNEKITNLLKDFVSFISWFNKTYLEYKSSGDVLQKELLVSIWSYAFDELSNGKSISEIINSSSEAEQVQALELYQLILKDN